MPAASTASSRLALVPRRWILPEPADPDVVAGLEAELRLPRPLCVLLAQRGHGEPTRAKAFLRPAPSHIHAASRLADMDAAVTRIETAIRRGETILVHGDYDVDGICSTALVVRALGMMGGSAVPFVPHRLDDGYDLGDAGIAAARGAGATLIVTADCGIVAQEAVRRAAAVGIDVIVTDHHAPGPTLPPALAVINPNRPDCDYPDKGLAGVGVAYKLVCALAEALGFPQARLTALLDLVAIATVADLAPLTEENRILVRWGLSVLPRTPNPGLRSLLRVTGLAGRDSVSAGQVAFVLAPRLNAGGRMGSAMRGVRLLLTDDAAEAERIAHDLERENEHRRSVDEATLQDAWAMIERDFDPDRDAALVLASDRWHPGVIGIVASRIVERLNRPTVLIAESGGEGKGSGRSIRGFHLQQAFAACSSHLDRFGGHRAAAGCSLRSEQIAPFREAFRAYARDMLTPALLVPELRVDGAIELREANLDLARLLRHLAPFGVGNSTPTFVVRGASIVGRPRIVGTKHLRLTLGAEDVRLEAIGFGMADRVAECAAAPHRLDVAFHLEEDSWSGRRGRAAPEGVQARLVDLRPAG